VPASTILIAILKFFNQTGFLYENTVLNTVPYLGTVGSVRFMCLSFIQCLGFGSTRTRKTLLRPDPETYWESESSTTELKYTKMKAET
jgi:hypothetical protein